MNGFSFALRGLWYFRKSYAGVLAGSALGAMVLLGALMAGDSVKETLRQSVVSRLGKMDAVLTGGDRFFRAALADDITADGVIAAPVVMLRATVTVQRNGRALGGVRVMGVDDRFWKFSPGDIEVKAPHEAGFYVNDHLKRSLGLTTDEALVLRFDKPARIAADAPLAGKSAELIALRGNVVKTCGDREFGHFGLENTQLPQSTVFVPLRRLQEAIGHEGRANLMLLRGKGAMSEPVNRHATLEDYDISVVDVTQAEAVEIRTGRIFFDRKVADAIRRRLPQAEPVITYMANTISAKGGETPYSMVTAVGSMAAPFLPVNQKGVVLNSWLAGDLGVSAGDEVKMDYYALGDGNRLIEKSACFPVEAVVPLTDLAADRMWMPDFPGVAEAENAADWDAGVPIDLKRIRDKDEAYWDVYRGTPKMFLPFERGSELFGNRWGESTALRVPLAGASRESISKEISAALNPGLAGLVLRDIRGDGMKPAQSSVDFAGLFLGMSLFLMLSAVALTAMLFRFHIESRNRESGLLSALGISANKFLRWRLMEGCCVVTAGSVIGGFCAVAYTRILLGFLDAIWRPSGFDGMFRFHVTTGTWFMGTAGFILLMMLVIWRVARGQARRSASLRIEAGTEEIPVKSPQSAWWWTWGFVVAGLCAMVMQGLVGNAAAFFLAGFMGLLAGLSAYRRVLRGGYAGKSGELTLPALAELNCARRGTRSLVVVGCLASGVFMVVSVAAFRKHATDDWKDRSSGTGGFAFWVETTSAAESGSGKDTSDPIGLGDARRSFGECVPFRIGAGDDASCFNLNQVTRPRMLAADVTALSRLGAFTIKSVVGGRKKDWSILREGSVMRAFVDETTLMWVLKKKPGDQVIYQDERGAGFPVEIAGTLDDSVFQGCFVVDDARFLEHYPSSAGARVFLLDSDGALDSGRAILQKALADRGGDVETTRGRLSAFHAVENTYIAIFHLLGGLGVVVGSAGLGVITARNLMERRQEFTIIHSLGIPPAVIRRMVVLEVAHFIRWGLGVGLVAALVAISPALSMHGIWRSIGWLGLLVVLIAANAGFWSWLGYRGHFKTVSGSPGQSA